MIVPRKRNFLILFLFVASIFSACSKNKGGLDMFDSPSDVAILEENEIIDVPLAFVANTRNGKITKVDLKHEEYMPDLVFGSWMRSLHIATGKNRVIDQIAVSYFYNDNTDYAITIFANDLSRQQLLMIPYLDTKARWHSGCAPSSGIIYRHPICIQELDGTLKINEDLTFGKIHIKTEDGANLSSYITKFWLREGHTTTESWNIEFDSNLEAFIVTGSRSGIQEELAYLGETYYSDDNEVEFLIEGDLSELKTGDKAIFHTNNGIQEYSIKKNIRDLVVYNNETLIASAEDIVKDIDTYSTYSKGSVILFDLKPLKNRNNTYIKDVIELCPQKDGYVEECESKPIAITLDEKNARVFISENTPNGGFYQLDLNEDSRKLLWTDGIAPNMDLAYVESDEENLSYQHLFIAHGESGKISLYDLINKKLVDVNPITSEIDPINLRSPIRGIAQSYVKVPLPQRNDSLEPESSILVTASTLKGDLYSIRGESGCLPFATLEKSISSFGFYPVGFNGINSNPVLITDPETNESVVLNNCGGLLQNETWTLTYNQQLMAYQVHGSVSNTIGKFQKNLAYENTRYTSDNGEFSILIRSGTIPTMNGDKFVITLNANVNPVSAGIMPSDPVVYTQVYGDRNQPWTEMKFRSVSVVPAYANNALYKVDMSVSNSSSNSIMSILQ